MAKKEKGPRKINTHVTRHLIVKIKIEFEIEHLEIGKTKDNVFA